MSEAETRTQEPDQKAPEEEEKGPDVAISDALRGMISFFTIIRLDVGRREFDAMERNFWLAPLPGLAIGIVEFITIFILGYACRQPCLVIGAAAVATPLILSKFLHIDGLADFGDGMTVSSGRREDHVRALKDTLIGAGGFGVALTTVLMSFACYVTLGSYCGHHLVPGGMEASGFSAAISISSAALLIEVLVKNAQVAAAAFGRPGNGMAARQVENTGMNSLIRSSILTAAIAAAIVLTIHLVLDRNETMLGGLSMLACIISILLSIFVGWLMARTANETFGFVNGDILGATNEIARAAILLMIVILLGICT